MIRFESAFVRTYRRRQSRKGAMLILFAVMLILLIVAVVFSVDVAFMQLTRTELRSATDAACRAATEALSRTQDPDEAIAAAKLYASKNLVSSSPLVLTDDDIVLGRSNRQTDGSISFSAGETPFNTIQIRGRRTADSPSGEVPLFFGRLLGVSSFEPLHVSRAMNLDRDISLVVDRSGSMKQLVSGAGMPPGKSACDPPDPSLSRWGTECGRSIVHFGTESDSAGRTVGSGVLL
ncbi:MAG: TadE/TadG family type IV pilus assembly protein [Pirellulaceae bacterium]